MKSLLKSLQSCALSMVILLLCSQQGFASGQSLVKNSNFSQIDEKGNPVGWLCQCSDATSCELKQDAASGNSITLHPGCSIKSKYTLFLPFNNNQGIQLKVITSTVPAHFQDFSLLALNGSSNKLGEIETTHISEVKNSTEGFEIYSKPVSSENISYLLTMVINAQTKPIKIKKIDVIQDGANPASKSASLLKATHMSALKILPNSTAQEIWMPLPLDYASQVPLWITVKPEPLAVIDSVRYTKNSIGNWGTIIKRST